MCLSCFAGDAADGDIVNGVTGDSEHITTAPVQESSAATNGVTPMDEDAIGWNIHFLNFSNKNRILKE